MRILSKGGGIHKGGKSSLADNFSHYGLPPPDIVCASQNCRAWRGKRSTGGGGGGGGGGGEGFVDAIVTDPPYGIRAGARKIAAASVDTTTSVTATVTISADEEAGNVVKKKQGKGGQSLASSSAAYSTVECLDDLLDLAAEVLVMGGKLVFFVPSTISGVSSSSSPRSLSASSTADTNSISDAAETTKERERIQGTGAGTGDLSTEITEKYLSHPCLQRVSCSEDASSVGRGKSVLRRHLLVLRKVAPYWHSSRSIDTDNTSSSGDGPSAVQSSVRAAREKRNREDREAIHVCVRDVGANVYKDSRRKVQI